eukprot:scaffold1671_cov344-Pavlova_lutheri.AAC.44
MSVSSPSGCVYAPVFDFDVSAEGLEASDVKVHGPGSNVASSWEGHDRLFQPRQQWSEHEEGSTERSHGVFGRRRVVDAAGVYGEGSTPSRPPVVDFDIHLGSDGFQDVAHPLYVSQLRHHAQHGRGTAQQRPGQHGQRGVFGPGDSRVSLEDGPSAHLECFFRPLIPGHVRGTQQGAVRAPVRLRRCVRGPCTWLGGGRRGACQFAPHACDPSLGMRSRGSPLPRHHGPSEGHGSACT